MNPFTLTFGEKPELFIERYKTLEKILLDFESPKPSSRVYMITGIRGSGKTVLMSSIANKLSVDKNWAVVELNSSSKSLTLDFASQLYAKPEFKKTFLEMKLDFSVFGFGISLESKEPEQSYQVTIKEMLEEYKKKNYKVLITIDECINSREMQELAGLLQIYIREGFPIYVLLTGLYKNIEELQNNKNLTFLYRAERVYLDNLDLTQVYKKYNEVFNDDELSKKMAKLTFGYPYAFQTLGYLVHNSPNHDLNGVLAEYEDRLIDYVYRKIWSECTEFEKDLLKAIADSDSPTTGEVAKSLNKERNLVSNYKKQLEKKGLIGKNFGEFEFTLPLFKEYVQMIL